MDSVEVAIVGGGFAGAAAAWSLAQRGLTDILVLEKEASAGVHASGRNAAMVRQVVGDRAIAALAREGAAFIRSPPAKWREKAAFEQNGSLLLAKGREFDALRDDVRDAVEHGLEVRLLEPGECLRIAPWIEGDAFDGGAWCPSDGIVDIAALLQCYLNEAERLGARVRYGAAVTGVTVDGGRVAGLKTTAGPVAARTVVNAAGAWAGEIGRQAGALEVPVVAYRRHLFVTGRLDGVDPAWPFVWDISHEAYFRPEPPGLLLCACDESPQPPGDAQEAPEAMELLAEKMIECFPRLADVSIARQWAGLRTMTPDRRFAVGWDTNARGLFWLAGLGGHGVTTSAAAGRLAAELILRGPGADAGPFDPSRFGGS